MINRPCPICGSCDESKIFAGADFDPQKLDDRAFMSRKLPEYMHYRLVACAHCDLLYASPIPKHDLLAKAYRQAPFDAGGESRYASRTYAGFLSDIISRLPDTSGALDIGTGDGTFLEELFARGFNRAVGVEPSQASVSSAKDNIRPLIKNALFKGEEFVKESFSLVTCFQTLEHVSEPLESCRSIYSLLKPKGAAFFICHNRRALQTKILGMKSPIYDIEHLQLFSRKSVEFLLNKCGFVDITIKTVFNYYPLHYWLKLLPFPLRFKLLVIRILKKIKIGYLPILLPAGNIAIIGYKK